MHSKKSIRALQLYQMFVAYGVYRPQAKNLFGRTVDNVAQLVLKNEHLVVEPPGVQASMVGYVQETMQNEGMGVKWLDVEKCLLIMDMWESADGQDETFVGSLRTYFPLHYKNHLDALKETWGSYGLLFKWKTMGRPNEWSSRVPYKHPSNAMVPQSAWMYQPIDEIRDYFGEEVGFYFAWLGLYARSLVFPSVLGILVQIGQIIAGGIDQNPLTIPYTVFFAMWSTGLRRQGVKDVSNPLGRLSRPLS